MAEAASGSHQTEQTAGKRGNIDIERQCAVPKADGKLCGGSLKCKRHSMTKKRAVAGRSAPFDVLLRLWDDEGSHKTVDQIGEEEGVLTS